MRLGHDIDCAGELTFSGIDQAVRLSVTTGADGAREAVDGARRAERLARGATPRTPSNWQLASSGYCNRDRARPCPRA